MSWEEKQQSASQLALTLPSAILSSWQVSSALILLALTQHSVLQQQLCDKTFPCCHSELSSRPTGSIPLKCSRLKSEKKKRPKEVELKAFQSSLWTQPMVNKIVNPALGLPVRQHKCHELILLPGYALCSDQICSGGVEDHVSTTGTMKD